MHIAYIALYLRNHLLRGGVGQKALTQIRLWKENGHEAKLFLITPDSIEFQDISLSSYKIYNRPPLLRVLLREVSRTRAMIQLVKQVREYKPDIIYLRYGLYCYPLHHLSSFAPLIIELNTNDFIEYDNQGKFNGIYNRLTRNILLRPAAGFTPVSYEIAEMPENTYFNKPYQVLANGIDVKQYPILPPPSNLSPIISFVGSPASSWHGVEKIFPLAKRYQDLRFDVVGYSAEDIGIIPPENIRFYGFQSQSKVYEILSKADLALGSLALHRNKMNESSSLKVREALACGLPVVLASKDTDLDLNNAGFDFILRIPNRETNIEESADQIYQFAYQMIGKRADRKLVAPLIDQSVKETSRLSFFNKFLT